MYYSPRPYSRSFVRHLDLWYAQSHQDEDFAETFAVLLTSDSLWEKRNRGWPGEYQSTIDQVLEDMIQRCRELDLLVPIAKDQAKLDFTILLTVHPMNFLRSGRQRVAL
jgi:hypothetical protein